VKFTLKDYQDEAVKDVLVNLKKAQRRWHEDDDKGLSINNCYNFAPKAARESERYLLYLFLDGP